MKIYKEHQVSTPSHSIISRLVRPDIDDGFYIRTSTKTKYKTDLSIHRLTYGNNGLTHVGEAKRLFDSHCQTLGG